jgi:predicted protein tyrosine phosphatase
MTTRALFVCSQNRLRSPTAEAVFSAIPGLEVDSAGTNKDAASPVTLEAVDWADVIFVMEKVHRNRLSKMFGSRIRRKRVICLNVPDEFEYMDPVLVKLLKAVVPKHLPSVFALGRNDT